MPIVGIGAEISSSSQRSFLIKSVLSEPLSPTDLISCSFTLFYLKRWACSTLPCTILECFMCRFKLNTVPRICICCIQLGHVHSVTLYSTCMDKLCVGHFWCTFKLSERWVIPSFVPPLYPPLEILPLLAFCDKGFEVFLWFFVSCDTYCLEQGIAWLFI